MHVSNVYVCECMPCVCLRMSVLCMFVSVRMFLCCSVRVSVLCVFCLSVLCECVFVCLFVCLYVCLCVLGCRCLGVWCGRGRVLAEKLLRPKLQI